MSPDSSTANSYLKPVNATSNEEGAATSESPHVENSIDGAAAGGTNAADEVTGIRLALIIIGLCFSNILTGLASWTAISLMGYMC